MSTTATMKPTSLAAAPPAHRNPKDSMKSTWRSADKSTWGPAHWLIYMRGIYHQSLDVPVPVHQKTDKIPYLPEWQVHRWILYHAAIPLALHQAYCTFFAKSPSAWAIVAFYTYSFITIGSHQLNVMRRMGHKYGFLDGDKHARDDVPDHSVVKTVISLLATVGLRMTMTTWLTYDKSTAPIDMNWLMLPVFIGAYGVVLDFWFYWYHRLMHDNDSLWQYHRTHHLTKHPSALLTEYADEQQEIIDMLGIPFLTYITMRFVFGLNMDFYSWWICHNYVMWTELSGHSGLRIHSNTPSTISWLLKLVHCELVTEDHDLHHRMGWKKSHNYGKQTRLWDRIFGTCHDRIESTRDNVDYNNVARWPIFR